MAALLGTPGGARPAPRPVPAVAEGPAWTRADWYALAGITAAIVIVVGLLLALTSGFTISATVKSDPSNTATSFTVTSSNETSTSLAGDGFYPGEPITVGSDTGTVQSVFGDVITLTSPLSGGTPAASATVNQSLPLPFATTVIGQVASSPAPTKTTFTMASGGNGAVHFPGTVTVGGQSDTISSVSGEKITLTTALSTAPHPGETVTGNLLDPGALINGANSLMGSLLGVVFLPLAALIARPLVVRLRRASRPRVMPIIFFGVVIWILYAFLIELILGLLPASGLGAYVLEILVAMAAGYLLAPLVYPFLSRMLQPRPRRT
jgi:hypothetical protein